MHYVFRTAALGSLVAFGCHLSAAPLNLPLQGEVTEIVTTWKDGLHQQDQLSRITDPKQIEAALEFIKSLNPGLRKPGSVFRKPQYVTRFLQGGSEVLIVFVGENWISVREGSTSATKNQMRRITAEQRQQFLSLFNVQ